MKVPRPRFTSQAEVGAGTLAAFVAIILVVAVGAGVLVNAVVVLQDETGTVETDEPTDSGIQVIEADVAVNDPAHEGVDLRSGIGNSVRPVVYELRLEVTPTNETAQIDLADLTLVIRGPDSDAVLTHISDHVDNGDLTPDHEADGTEVAEGVYFVQPTAVERFDTVMTDQGDRYEIVVPVGVYVDADGAIRRGPESESRGAAPVHDYEDADVGVEIPGTLGPNQGIDNTALDVLEPADTVTVEIRREGDTATTVTIEIPSLDGEAGSQVPVRPQ